MEKSQSNNSDKNFKICSIKFSLKPKVNDSIIIEDKDDAFEQTPSFNIIAQEFMTVLQLLWKYMHSIGSVAERTSISNLATMPLLLDKISEREKKAKESESPIAEIELNIDINDEINKESSKKISINIYEIEHLLALNEFRQNIDAALRILNETALQQIVNAYEQILWQLLSWHFYNNPDAAPKDKSLTYNELLGFSSFDEAKKHIVDEEIENFLKRKDTDEQLKYIKTELKADLSNFFPYLAEFKEIMLRRHAIVHAGGIASAEYIRRVKPLKVIDLSDIKENNKIPLSPRYVINAWNLFCSMGVILLHLVAKECARSRKSKDEEDQADKFLNNAAFTCIQNNQLDAAEIILTYANKLHLAKDPSNLQVIVNLAQTYKWKDKIDECNKLLDSKDWTAYSSLFQLCVAALRDEEDNFKKLLVNNANQKAISITELCEWPVFKLMRVKPYFNDLIKEIFGEEIKSVADLIKPKMINVKPEKTIEALIDYIHRSS